MSDGQQIAAGSSARAVDLEVIEEAQRAATWCNAADTYFPGLCVRNFDGRRSTGWMNGRRFGSGELWTIFSPPLHVQFAPSDNAVAGSLGLPIWDSFSVILQMRGSTTALQRGRICNLQPHNICLIDGHSAFELSVSDSCSQVVILRIPRRLLLSRHPHLEQKTAEVLDTKEGGVSLFRNVLLDIWESAPRLRGEQCASALAGIVQMLGMLKSPADDLAWRARAALTYIDAHLSERSLNARSVAEAQHVSRRHLDALLARSLRTSLNEQIWNRRLQQAAAELLDPLNRSRSVAEIAFDCGFEAAPHFSRLFKRYHGLTPREWRRRGARQSGC